jgi:hypothetical protein
LQANLKIAIFVPPSEAPRPKGLGSA